ncbi:MAG: GIY-YIG nuclease family protein [Fidelibacterota bacterium]
MFYVYVLESITSNRLYIGQTSHLAKRLIEHLSGKSPYTRTREPWILIGTFFLK